jgi:hypothetical protein
MVRSTTLAADIDTAAGTVVVADLITIATPFIVLIGSERWIVTDVDGTSWSVQRASMGTAASTASAGTSITILGTLGEVQPAPAPFGGQGPPGFSGGTRPGSAVPIAPPGP